MENLVLEGMRPYDGSYPLDLAGQPFTIREWGWLKDLSGYLPGTASDGFLDGDPRMMLTIAVILLRRAGKVQAAEVPAVFESLADKPAGAIRWETVGMEDDVEADPTESSSGSTTYSGDDSSASLAPSVAPPRPIGTPVSDSSPSVPATSAS